MESEKAKMSNLPNFDPVWCEKIMRLRAAGSVMVLLIALVIMLAFDSPKCPGWRLPDDARTSLWTLIVLIVVPAVVVAVHQARNWDKLAHRVMHGEPEPETKFPPTPFEKLFKHRTDELRLTLPLNRVFAVVAIGWVLFCSIPLILIAGSCVTWY
jgi:hypothetical protein